MQAEEVLVLALAVGASILAIALGLTAESFVRRAQGLVMLVSGALLVGATVFHLAPEAVALGAAGVGALVAGVVAGAGLELAGRGVSAARAPGGGAVIARTALIALAAHSTLDGAVYSIAFEHDGVSGLLVGLGLVAHEAPEGAVALMLALEGGWTRWRAAWVAVGASSATTVLGWGLGVLVGATAHQHIELLFAGSAGLVAYSGVRLVMVGLRQRRAAAT